jgi:hypothetical protein
MTTQTIHEEYKLNFSHISFKTHIRTIEDIYRFSNFDYASIFAIVAVNNFEDIICFCRDHRKEQEINNNILEFSNEKYVYQCLKYMNNGSGDIIKCANDLIESEPCRVFGNTGCRCIKDHKEILRALNFLESCRI